MKTKALIGIAVASTFGWATSTYAGSSHEVITPLSVTEAGEVLPSTSSGGFGSSAASISSAQPASSAALSEPMAATSATDESIARANEGIYSDFYVVSAPVMVEAWDYYVIDTSVPSTVQVATPVDIYLVPAYDVVVF